MATSTIKQNLMGMGNTQLRAYSRWISANSSVSFSGSAIIRSIVYTLGAIDGVQGEYLVSDKTDHTDCSIVKVRDASNVVITYNNGTFTVTNNATAASVLLIVESWGGATLTFS